MIITILGMLLAISLIFNVLSSIALKENQNKYQELKEIDDKFNKKLQEQLVEEKKDYMRMMYELELLKNKLLTKKKPGRPKGSKNKNKS